MGGANFCSGSFHGNLLDPPTLNYIPFRCFAYVLPHKVMNNHTKNVNYSSHACSTKFSNHFFIHAIVLFL